MSTVYCCVPGCPNANNGSKESRKARMVQIFFSPPQDEALFKQWQSAVPVGNRALTRQDKLCDFHFKKSEVVLFNETKLPNGNVRRVPASEPKLKAGTVPSIFPNRQASTPSVVKINEKLLKATYSQGQKPHSKRKLSTSDESEDDDSFIPEVRKRGRPRKYPGASQARKLIASEKKMRPGSVTESVTSFDDDFSKDQEVNLVSSSDEGSQEINPSIRLVPLSSLVDSSKKKYKPGPKSVIEARKRKDLESESSPGPASKKIKDGKTERMDSLKEALRLAVQQIDDDSDQVYEIEHVTDPGDTEPHQDNEIFEVEEEVKKTIEELEAELSQSTTATQGPTNTQAAESEGTFSEPKIMEVISLRDLEDGENLEKQLESADDKTIEREMAEMLEEGGNSFSPTDSKTAENPVNESSLPTEDKGNTESLGEGLSSPVKDTVEQTNLPKDGDVSVEKDINVSLGSEASVETETIETAEAKDNVEDALEEYQSKDHAADETDKISAEKDSIEAPVHKDEEESKSNKELPEKKDTSEAIDNTEQKKDTSKELVEKETVESSAVEDSNEPSAENDVIKAQVEDESTNKGENEKPTKEYTIEAQLAHFERDADNVPQEKSSDVIEIKETEESNAKESEENIDDGSLPGIVTLNESVLSAEGEVISLDGDSPEKSIKDEVINIEEELMKIGEGGTGNVKKQKTAKSSKKVKTKQQDSDEEILIPSSPEIYLGSESDDDPTWAPTAETVEISDDNDTDPGEGTPGNKDSSKAKKSPKANKKKSGTNKMPSAIVTPEVSRILNQNTLQQILKTLNLPLDAPVTFSIAEGAVAGKRKEIPIAPRAEVPAAPRYEYKPGRGAKPSRLQIGPEKSRKQEKLLGIKMFEGLGKIKKAFDFSTFLSDIEDELQFRKFCLVLRECLRDVRENKNAVTNVGKLTVNISRKVMKNPLPIPDLEPIAKVRKEQQPSVSASQQKEEITDEAETFECMTVDSNVENHYESSSIIERAMEEIITA